MKYTLNKEKSEVTLSFETTEAEWKDAEMKAYRETKGQYRIPGFRQGHAPKHMIESVYGPAVFADDAMDVLIREGYELFLSEHTDIVPLDRPTASVDAFDGKSLKFSLKFPVRPDVKLGEYKGVKIPKVEYTVSDEQIDEELKRALERSARIEDKAGEAAEGDTVNLDYSGTVDGVKFDGGTAEKYNLTLGSHTFIPGFEEQLIGVKAGDEREVKVKFPEDYHADALKGKEAVFACKINGVTTRVLPEMNDEWAKDVSEYSTLEEYRNGIRENMVKMGERRARSENENNVINAIVDKSEADIPEVMIKSYMDDMLRDMEMRLYYQGMKLEDYFKYMGTSEEEYRKEHHDDARRGALTRLVLEELIKKENITATDEEAEKKYLDSMPAPADGSEKRKPDERELEYLKSELVMDKLLDLLLSEAVFEDKPAEEPAKKPAAKRSTSKTTAKKSTKDTEEGEKPAAKKSTRTTKKASEEPKAE